MELILAALAIVLTAALVITDADKRPGRLRVRAAARYNEPLAEEPGTIVEFDKETGPFDIVAPQLQEEDLEYFEEVGDDPGTIGVPHVHPDPARFIQTEVAVDDSPRIHVLAYLRLGVTITICGAGIGVLIIIAGRLLFVLLRNFTKG